MLESQPSGYTRSPDTSIHSDRENRWDLRYCAISQLQNLVACRGPIVVDGDALATIPSPQPVGSPSEFLTSLERINRIYSEIIGELRRTLRPEDSLARLDKGPVQSITREQFAALVELYMERFSNQAKLPSFLSTSEPDPVLELDGDILGLIPSTSTVPFGEIRGLTSAAIACKRLLLSAGVDISQQSDVWPSREETVTLFAAVLFQSRVLGKTIELPSFSCAQPHADGEMPALSAQSEGTSSAVGHVPSHMEKHRRSA